MLKDDLKQIVIDWLFDEDPCADWDYLAGLLEKYIVEHYGPPF